MTRDEAYKLMCEMIKSPNLQKHGLAVEAIMGSLCNYLKEKQPELPAEEFNEEEWGIVGMLHDADYETVGRDLSRHTLVTEEKLLSLGVPKQIIDGVKAHNPDVKPNRDNFMEKAVYCADELSGLIIAAALVRPDKKLSSLTVDSVMKRFREKGFAAGAKREQIQACEKELGIPLNEFVAIALKAMQNISGELGL